ncbi:MAG TPA: S8 family serine peptidase [Capillimicrobium sp.]|nr:S8 family serine peptidase [Capillimicrobium sp.]
MQRLASLTALVAVTAAGALALAGTASAATGQAGTRTYVVLYEDGASPADARAAIEQAGGRIVRENTKIGVATVEADAQEFESRAAAADPLVGAAPNEPIGEVPAQVRKDERDLERMTDARQAAAAKGAGKLQAPFSPVAGDPLAELQWDMRMIGATPEGSYDVTQGSHAVRVGIVDTGIDGSHPDIAPNFNAALSRNFTVDDPVVDGACESDPDGSCQDPADVDEDGHGTHVAGTVAAPLNGIGIGGVAPGVELVNLRAGQDSGYFFLGPTLDALTYAGDHGIDVVNMSYYIDPWLFNCAANPADSPAEQREQQLIVAATQRALTYAREHGVTLVAAEGNGHTDLGKPAVDGSSPDYPPDSERVRTIDNSCLNMPTEGEGVIGVTSVGPSERKAYYSDYGVEQADVSAPGGDRRDYHGTDRYLSPANTILAPYPESLARANGEIDADGQPTTPFVVADCSSGTCSYYQYLQGTSMASPHATGVAALIVARYGRRDRVNGGVTMDPALVERQLKRTARDTPCPEQNPFDYPDLGDEYTALCEGDASFNGFYGEGIVDAFAAVQGHKAPKLRR